MTDTRRRGVGFDGPAPPDPSRSAYDWEHIAAECRKKPGEWYLVFERDRHSLATSIRANSVAALRPAVNRTRGQTTGFEVRTANTVKETTEQPRLCSMWVRYMPEQGRKKR